MLLTLLVIAIGLVLAFEFVNGFHDTANAVRTILLAWVMTLPVTVILSGSLFAIFMLFV